MDELLLRYLRKQTSEDENATVSAWLDGSAERQRELAELRRMVEVGSVVDRRVDSGEVPQVEDVIWRAEARVVRSVERGGAGLGRRLRPRRSWLRWSDWAAVGVVGVVCAVLWQAVAQLGGGDAMVPIQEFATGPGETEMVRLTDGSVIRLGPDSRLSAAWPVESLQGSTREVTLQGEAFFAVATDEARPFRIVTDAGTVQVLGTRFHLAAGADELAVAVIEGRVALAGQGHEVQVGAGQTTSLLRGQPQDLTVAPPMENVAPWLDDFLIFHDTPLGVAMAEVEKRYRTNVVVGDPVLLDRTLTMWFESKSLEEVMTVVCSVVDARCSIAGGVVRMESADSGAGS